MTESPRAHRSSLLALALATFSVIAAAETATHERLTRIAHAYVDAIAAADPIAATSLGLPGADGRLVLASEPARAARIARLRAWKAELDAVDAAAATLVDANDVKLLRAEFDGELNELVVRESDRKNYAGPCLRLAGALYTQFLHLPIVGREGARPGDVDRAWDDIVARLEQGPAFIVAGQRLVTQPGRLYGTVGSRRIAGIPDFIGGALSDAATVQLAARPDVLARFVAGRDRTLRRWPRRAPSSTPTPPPGPTTTSIGKAAYEQMLRDEQLLPFDSADIERMARDELAHGWAEEAWLRSLSAHRKLPFGAASGGGMAPRRAGARRLLPRSDRRAARVRSRARRRHRAGVARHRWRSSRRRRSCSRSRRARR